MKKKDLIYIPHQDTWTEHFPNAGGNKNDYTLYLSDPQALYNKLLRAQQKLRNKRNEYPLSHNPNNPIRRNYPNPSYAMRKYTKPTRYLE